MVRMEVFDMIYDERERQAQKWGTVEGAWGKGDCSSPDIRPEVKAVVLGEECGEVARAVLDRDGDGLAKELVQVAAVAVAWLEMIVAAKHEQGTLL